MGLSKELKNKLKGKDDLGRLDIWQESRLEEEARVKDVLAVPANERTQVEHNLIAHSTYGTTSKHGY